MQHNLLSGGNSEEFVLVFLTVPSLLEAGIIITSTLKCYKPLRFVSNIFQPIFSQPGEK